MEKVVVYGSSVVTEKKSLSLFKKKIVSSKVKGKLKKFIDVSDIYSNKKSVIDISWLKAASKKYHISDDIKDYVVESVPVLTAGIPNRNMQAFSLNALTDFSPEYGCLRYRTFIGKPTFVEHKNSDMTAAKGVNIDSSLIFVPGYKLAKVVVLSAFDRTKDTDLVRDILRNKKNTYSMGSLVTYFVCSVCGGIMGPSMNRTCTCPGTDYTNLASYGSIVKGKLHYLLAGDPVFICNSRVAHPADISAISDPV